MTDIQPASIDRKERIRELVNVFLKLGLLGFGGPAVHIAMMEEEVVRKRQWMTRDHFLDLIGATNLIPGPNSTEMALHCGQERAGFRGLLVAGACFILPAVIVTGLIAWAYQLYGALPQVRPFTYGIAPAIIGIIVALMIRLGKTALKNLSLWFIGIAALVMTVFSVSEIIVLFGSGLLGVLIFYGLQKRSTLNVVAPSVWTIFWVFLKTGAILYGSGYVLFAFLDGELVRKGLLTHTVLTDAIAVGQFTPGPVFSSATFIGWQLGGWQGAAVATVGIFLPAFLFVGLLNPLVARLRRVKALAAFLDAVNVAAIALILSVCFELGRAAIAGWQTILIAVLGFIVAFFFKKVNTAFIVLGGALLGYFLI